MSNRSRTSVSEQIAVRMPLAELAALDSWRNTHLLPGLANTRAGLVREAVRRLVGAPPASPLPPEPRGRSCFPKRLSP